ncbi:MAG: hypothetical protein CME63_04910 [Halobacteriovoraceae bacterium]|nr:hypothetical protein [Halobacteriovoraceae bacterium]MBC97065.1 hypothetical protein [Halobacteriovoraceae bacterium]|tara:strand:+ start:91948 stop:92487 length:540 start_codon:yes stop_codon:yes gene_type:complete
MLNRLSILGFLFLFLVSCSQNSLDIYKDENPVFHPKKFFSGKMIAQGMVTNRSGEVIKRFNCDIVGTWNGDEGELDERFTYADGSKQRRIWKLSYDPKTQSLTGRASDIVGTAQGEFAGNTFHFTYDLKINVDESEYEIYVDDWMHLIDENTLMAKSRMSKWGFDVGEITLIMKKVDGE